MTISSSAVTAASWREAVPPSPSPSARAGGPRDVAAAKEAVPVPAQERAALVEVNQTLRMASIGVQFEFDKEADTLIVKVVDVDSGELIRQMPSEEVVRISRALGKLQGLLVHQAV
ncbi:flagellar protein FlaG [Polaromonas sp.]|uniref:flagellar protein FlaG n=1 Tax=Polaromonas sp. TaxID=1869339 RepID=UPI00248A269A|nr:flagellar protein FlaG [Polaromonas sp.]MDI1275597.1 flagellar protein FlaG [Polaromonas sp.]